MVLVVAYLAQVVHDVWQQIQNVTEVRIQREKGETDLKEEIETVFLAGEIDSILVLAGGWKQP